MTKNVYKISIKSLTPIETVLRELFKEISLDTTLEISETNFTAISRKIDEDDILYYKMFSHVYKVDRSGNTACIYVNKYLPSKDTHTMLIFNTFIKPWLRNKLINKIVRKVNN